MVTEITLHKFVNRIISSLLDENKTLLTKGSESYLYMTNFLGKKVIIKERRPKKYRHKIIDSEIRYSRLRLEARIIKTLIQKKIKVPSLFGVDEEKHQLILEFIYGKQLIEFLSQKEYLFLLGKIVAKMHISHIIHADLTPQNVIISNSEIYLIDFGLAYFSDELKDKIMDLFIFKGALLHFESNKAFENFLQGYAEVVGEIEFTIIKKEFDSLLTKGRYKQKLN